MPWRPAGGTRRRTAIKPADGASRAACPAPSTSSAPTGRPGGFSRSRVKRRRSGERMRSTPRRPQRRTGKHARPAILLRLGSIRRRFCATLRPGYPARRRPPNCGRWRASATPPPLPGNPRIPARPPIRRIRARQRPSRRRPLLPNTSKPIPTGAACGSPWRPTTNSAGPWKCF